LLVAEVVPGAVVIVVAAGLAVVGTETVVEATGVVGVLVPQPNWIKAPINNAANNIGDLFILNSCSTSIVDLE
jgi:hypothetical protein